MENKSSVCRWCLAACQSICGLHMETSANQNRCHWKYVSKHTYATWAFIRGLSFKTVSFLISLYSWMFQSRSRCSWFHFFHSKIIISFICLEQSYAKDISPIFSSFLLRKTLRLLHLSLQRARGKSTYPCPSSICYDHYRWICRKK